MSRRRSETPHHNKLTPATYEEHVSVRLSVGSLSSTPSVDHVEETETLQDHHGDNVESPLASAALFNIISPES